MIHKWQPEADESAPWAPAVLLVDSNHRTAPVELRQRAGQRSCTHTEPGSIGEWETSAGIDIVVDQSGQREPPQ